MGNKFAKRNFLGTSALTRPLFALGAASALFGAGPAHAIDANTLPQNPNVVGGKDSFSQSGSTLNVNQQTNRTVIDWRSFDIGSKAQVNFNQPGTSSIAVNRVNGSTDPTQIQGGLHANGQVWILNPNGVFFGKTARVDAAGIVATTADVNNKAFMSGSSKLQFTGGNHGSVVNRGNISVGQAGLAAFVAPSVRNSGTIRATVGRVALAAGSTYTLDLAGDHLVELGLGSVHAVVDNSGKIVNPGGTISLTAKAASDVVSSVVNVSGVVSASSVSKSGGTIILGADNVTTTASAHIAANAGTNGTGGSITSVANKLGTYDGVFAARGGSKSGSGGKIETSGHDVSLASTLRVSASAASGKAGKWTLDPVDLDIDSAYATLIQDTLAGGTSFEASTSGYDNGDITLSHSINASATGGADLTITGRHLYSTNGSLINISGAGSGLVLNVNTVNRLADTSSQNWVQDALNLIGSVDNGTTVHLGAGIYAPNISITTDNVKLTGDAGAEILVPNPSSDSIQINAIDIYANNVTVQNLEIAGPATTSYKTYAWGNRITRGIAVHNGVQNFDINNNNIHGLRNDILIDGRNTGSVTDNIIDNSKSGISVQYTDAGAGNSEGYTIDISGNSEGTFGNEWGINTHLNGHYVGSTYYSNSQKIATDATSSVQAALLAFKAANNGMTAQDQGYSQSNRTDVTVGQSGSDSNQGSPLSNLGSIQGGINAVVAGGTVNVLDGTYTVSSGYISIGKSLNLIGESESGVIIDAHGASSYGMRIIGGTDGVTLENFTLYGVVASGGYGIKAEDTTNLDIENVTSHGAYKAQFDLNGVRGGTLNNVTADGSAGAFGGAGSTKGAAIAITDSQDILVENSHTSGGSYGGLALYQSNKAGGYSYQAANITIAASNTFAESNPVYMEDESATNDFANITVAGFSYVAGLDSNPADTYKFFQTSKANAESYLDSIGATASGYVEGWTGTAGDNNFSVDTVNTHAMSIQAAVNAAAASGATINVGAGTYQGQVYIVGKSLSIVGSGIGSTTISAPDTLAHSFTAGGNPYKAVVSVEGGGTVTVSDLTVDGRGVGDANNRLLGIGIYDSNATIDGVRVTRVRGGGESGSLNGVQAGTGIEAYGDSGLHTVTVKNSTIDDFQKNGIAFVGKGITANVQNNTITGAGTTGAIAQNGIEFYGVNGTINGTISGNTITGVSYATPDSSSTGIILINSANTTVSGNTVTGEGSGDSSNGIYASGSSNVVITGNTVSDFAWGVWIDDYYGTTSSTVQNNVISNNGVALGVGYSAHDASSMIATGNSVTGNDVDVELDSDSATTSFLGNWWGTTDDAAIASKMDGSSANLVDFSTYLSTGTDTSGATGFQGDFSNLTVTTLGAGSDRIGTAMGLVTDGGLINLRNGSYTLTGELDITKSLTLKGQSEAGVDITSNSTGYGINVTADNVSLQNFTYHGPTGTGATYGIKVTPDTGAISDRLLNFDIENVTIDRGYRTGLDLNGVVGATINNVSVSNIVHGNGIALTDSANVTITNSSTSNNAWGGLALYQTNSYYDQQLTGIVVDGTNTFNETNGVYAEDQSASKDMGSLTLAGYGFAVIDKTTNAADQYTFFQKTEQNALDFATDASLNGGHLTLANTYVEGWSGSALNGNLYVGEGANGSDLLINTAIQSAAIGDTINVASGSYAEDVAAGKQLTFDFGDVTVDSFKLTPAGAGSTLNGNLTATGAIALKSDATVNGDLTAASFTSDGTLAMTGDITTSGKAALTGASTITGDVTVGSLATGSTLALVGDLTSGDVTLGGATTVNGNVSAASFTAGSTYNQTGNLTASKDVTLSGASTITGDVTGKSFESDAALTLVGDLTATNGITLGGASSVTGDVSGKSFTANDTLALVGDLVATNGVTLNGASTVTGDVTAKTFKSNSTLALNGDLTAQGAAQFKGATTIVGNVQAASITAKSSFGLTGDATASGAITVKGASTLDGTLTGGSISLAATTLTGDTSLDTSAANGDIAIASVDGGSALSIDAGTGSVSLGNVGATAALASLTDASATTLTGNTYSAGSVEFDGDVTLTAATTTVSTGGGDITFNGDIFGTTNGDQSLVISAGTGTGSAASNGDITLQNAGTSDVRLGDMTVSGNNFNALTVWLAGDFNATLTGNQVFAADTLHAGGNVNSTVGGDASGHIEADGDVNIAANGNVSGTIGGSNVDLTGDDVNANVTAANNATVTGNTVEGSYTGTNVGIVARQNVDAAVDATNFELVAAGGSVDGTWTNYSITGSGIVYINGEPQVGVNPAQLVVEGFTLPAGTTIGANGQLILPQGVLLGLLSPGGGKPKMILVHTVQELGQLLADGYSVIVIDLSGKDKNKPIQLASN